LNGYRDSRKVPVLRIAAFWLGLLTAFPCSANTFVFWTTDTANVGATSSNDLRNVAAKVVITTSLNTVTVDITNLQTGIDRIDQAISSVDFLLHGISGVNPTGIAIKTDSGAAGTFSNATTFTTGTALTAIANPWSFLASTQLSGGLSLGAIHNTAASAKDLIIGPPSYNSDGTGSGTMRNPQNNEYLQTVIANHIGWTLTYNSGVVDNNTNVDAARMTFGLTYSSLYEEDLTETPEPASLGLFMGGLVLLGWHQVRRSRLKNNCTAL